MTDRAWLIVSSVSSFISVFGVIAAVGFLIYILLELRKLLVTVNGFIKNTEERLNPLLAEAELSLKSVRKITDDIGVVTDAARGVAESSRDILANLRTLSSIISDFREGVSLKTFALKSGVKTGFNFLIQHLKDRR